MPNDMPIKTTKIDLEDLATYQNSLPAGNTASAITNLAVLNSELDTKGLSALNSSLNSANKPTIEEIRQDKSEGLLKDLEPLTKTALFQQVAPNIPKFNPNFYAEIQKPPGEKSEEFKQFLNACSEIMPENGGK